MTTSPVAPQARRKSAPRLSAAPRADDPGSRSTAATPPHTVCREDLVRIRAYALYEGRGCEPGHALEDWLQAESELGCPGADACSS